MSLPPVTPFRLWHYQWLVECGPPLGGFGPHPGTDVLRYLEGTNAYTLVRDGTPLLCGGTVEQWPGRHIGWAWLNAQTGRHMVAATRAARRVMRNVRGRVECTVQANYELGHRWARLLGFQVETPVLSKYGPEGEDHVGYVLFVGD